MALNTFKLNFMYQFAANGWTESYYVTNTNTAEQNASFGPAGVSAQLGVRAKGVMLIGIRASNVANPRDSFLFLVEEEATGIPGLPQNPDTAEACALIRLNGQNGSKRFVWMRGIQDRISERDLSGNPVLLPSFKTRLDLWIAAIRSPDGAKLEIRTIAQPIPPARDPGIIRVAVNATNLYWTNIYTNDAVPTLGQRVVFHKMPSFQFPGLTGSFPVMEVGAGRFTIPYTLRNPTLAFFPPNANFRVAAYVYNGITGYQLEDWRSHRTGRPLLVTRGRRPAVNRRLSTLAASALP